MPFQPDNLTALSQGGGGFTLWHYVTTDSRATVTAVNYFAASPNQLKAGDLLLLRSSDAMAWLPVRPGPSFGTGSTLDGALSIIALTRAANLSFSISQSAPPVAVRGLELTALASGMVAGTTLAVEASVIGDLQQVVFTLYDGNGVAIRAPVVVAVNNGAAVASFILPAAGTGFRVKVEASDDPALFALSSSFIVGVDMMLLKLEAGGTLLAEDGTRLQR